MIKYLIAVTTLFIIFNNIKCVVNRHRYLDSPIITYSGEKKANIIKISLVFENGFSDSLEVYLNNSLIERKYFQTDESLGVVKNRGISIEAREKKELSLKIFDINNRKNVLNISMSKGYEFLYLNYYKQWHILYSNETKTYE